MRACMILLDLFFLYFIHFRGDNNSRSAGVWSSVGHVVGLGDRHGENLLIHTESGECVHVDFDCLFDKVKFEFSF